MAWGRARRASKDQGKQKKSWLNRQATRTRKNRGRKTDISGVMRTAIRKRSDKEKGGNHLSRKETNFIAKGIRCDENSELFPHCLRIGKLDPVRPEAPQRTPGSIEYRHKHHSRC